MVDSRRIEHQVRKSRPIRAATIIRDGKSSAEAPRPPESRTTAGLLGRDSERYVLAATATAVGTGAVRITRLVPPHRPVLSIARTVTTLRGPLCSGARNSYRSLASCQAPTSSPSR